MIKELSHPQESQIQDKFFREFLKDRDSIRVKNWSGWSYKKGRKHKERTRFYREFDIAKFARKSLPYGSYDLKLTGYEVKGCRKDRREKMLEPPFGEGLDQALALLQQGADFSYVIYPEPTNVEIKSALKEMCDRYAPNIGIIYVNRDLSWYQTYREAKQNINVNRDRTRDMLTSLITGGNYSEISELPLWAKRHQY